MPVWVETLELLGTTALDEDSLEELDATDGVLELLAAFDEPLKEELPDELEPPPALPFDEDDEFAIGISSTPQSLFMSLIGLSNSKSVFLQVPTELDNWDRTSLLVASHSFVI
jgi:hypothetical protein